MNNKGILIILDGYGEGEKDKFNAVDNAKTPYLKGLKQGSYSLLSACGTDVGLFSGELGGSEVGHTTIGAGRIVPSTAKKISDDISNHEFEKKSQIIELQNLAKQNKADMHIIGLMSDKNIHSDINHAYEIVRLFSPVAKHIYLHLITDGRDCGSADSLKYIKQTKEYIKQFANCEIASVGGRFYAMDREGNFDRVETATTAMFASNGTLKAKDIETYLSQQHKKGITDEYIPPMRVQTKADIKLKKKDILFFFNFREDRMREIVKTMAQFKTIIATMGNVATANTLVVYPTNKVKDTLSEYLSKQGKTQIKISETTKYAHVTFFLNGGEETPFPNEDRVHIPTEKVDNFAKTPKMQGQKITDATLHAIDQNYDAIIVNYSNPDMIGHTANYKATVTALENIDKWVKQVVAKAQANGYFVMITADHGNSESLRYPNGEPNYAHTLNPVFCVTLKNNKQLTMKKRGGLQDIAPTFISLMGLKPNPLFTGKKLTH